MYVLPYIYCPVSNPPCWLPINICGSRRGTTAILCVTPLTYIAGKLFNYVGVILNFAAGKKEKKFQ